MRASAPIGMVILHACLLSVDPALGLTGFEQQPRRAAAVSPSFDLSAPLSAIPKAEHVTGP
jgi:hypothetical protein